MTNPNLNELILDAPDHWHWLDVETVDQWPCPEQDWIIENLVTKGSLTLIAGPTQTGKSLFGLYVSRMMVQGGELFGKFKVKPVRKLLYLCLEDPPRRVKERLLDTDHEFERRPAKGSYVVHVAPGFKVSTEEGFLYLERLIKRGGFEVVFLDTYQKATPGVSSFNDEQQSLILHRLADFTRRLGLSLVILDHTRKTDSRNQRKSLSIDDIKGTGGKPQNADAVILVERIKTGQIKFQAFSKDSDRPVGILLDVSPKGSSEPKFQYAGELEELVSTSRERGQQNKERILEAMPVGEWIGAAEIERATGLSKSTIRKHLRTLIEEDRVDDVGINKTRKYCRINQSEVNANER